MTTGADARADWPWIAGRNELVRLIAANHHDIFSYLREFPGSLAGVDVFAKKRKPLELSMSEILDGIHRALEATGKEIANAATVEEVETARLHYATYEHSQTEFVQALLSTAQNILKKHPAVGGWLAGYGRRTVGGAMEIISPVMWEAGTPDWDNWRLVVADGTTFFGVRLLFLEEADKDTWNTVIAELDGDDAPNAIDRTAHRVTPQRNVNEWYEKRVNDWPSDMTPPSRDDDLEAALTHFKNQVTREQVREARREKAPELWTRHARRKTGGN